MTPILQVRKVVLNLSQAEFAKIAGVTQGTVSKWEAGKSEPNREDLSRIRKWAAKHLGEWDDRWFFEKAAS